MSVPAHLYTKYLVFYLSLYCREENEGEGYAGRCFVCYRYEGRAEGWQDEARREEEGEEVMSVTITGMKAADLVSEYGWSPEQVLSAMTASVSLQGGAAPTTVNLSFINLRTTGTVVLTNLPTASKGLATGQVWSDSGTLKIA